MIWFGFYTVFRKICGHVLCAFSRRAINNSAFFRTRAEKIQQLVERFVFGENAVSQVRAIEAGDVNFRRAQFQMRNDVLAHAAGRRGGKRHERHIWKKFSQLGNLAVFGTKIVSPFADAMRLVNRNELHIPFLQIGKKTGKHQSLRRDVEQFIFAVVQTAQTFSRFLGGER